MVCEVKRNIFLQFPCKFAKILQQITEKRAGGVCKIHLAGHRVVLNDINMVCLRVGWFVWPLNGCSLQGILSFHFVYKSGNASEHRVVPM